MDIAQSDIIKRYLRIPIFKKIATTLQQMNRKEEDGRNIHSPCIPSRRRGDTTVVGDECHTKQWDTNHGGNEISNILW